MEFQWPWGSHVAGLEKSWKYQLVGPISLPRHTAKIFMLPHAWMIWIFDCALVTRWSATAVPPSSAFRLACSLSMVGKQQATSLIAFCFAAGGLLLARFIGSTRGSYAVRPSSVRTTVGPCDRPSMRPSVRPCGRPIVSSSDRPLVLPPCPSARSYVKLG